MRARNFETYFTKRTDPDGAYAETWHSPQVGFDIKQIEHDSTGTSYVTMELLDYERHDSQPIANDSQFLTAEMIPILAGFSAILAVSAIIVIFLLKNKKIQG